MAELCLNTALNFKRQVKKSSLIVQTYNELGSLYLQTNEIEKAQKVLEECLKIKTKDAVRLFEVYQTLGDCYLQKGEIRVALTHWEKAANLASQSALLRQEHRITLKLVQYYESINVIKHREYLKRLYALNDIAEGDDSMKSQSELNLHLKDIGDPPDF